MAYDQRLLAAANNVQQNAQAALPVIPNNGNPRGANNMPGALGPAVLPNTGVVPPVDPLAWMKPSPHMDIVNQYLQKRMQPQPATQPPMQIAQPMPQAQPAYPVMPQQQSPVMPVASTQPAAPVSPLRQQRDMPVIPTGRGRYVP